MTETVASTARWDTLERWGPTLFLLGFALELVFALNHGVAYLMASVEFMEWIYPSVLLGRVAALLGVAGLTVPLTALHPHIGKLSRIILGLAVVFTLILTLSSILNIVGILSFTDFVATPVLAVFGIGTIVLTLLSFALFGVVGLRTDAYPTVVGALMLVATLAILFVLVGSGTFSTNARGAVGEGINALVFLTIWHILSTETTTTTDRASNPSVE